MSKRFDANAFSLTEEAPAKINLALHVTGQRSDGYHLLDMLVTFTRLGDRIGFLDAAEDGLEISGSFADGLCEVGEPTDNLVLRARDALRQEAGKLGVAAPPVFIHLEKNLPIASGIGGGSADAAAALRGLVRLWKLPIAGEALNAIGLQLGADVPMCLESRPLIARGIGEKLEPLPGFPSFAMVLGNPLVGVSTPAVFKQLARKDNASFPLGIGQTRSRADWLTAIAALRNDLEPPALSLCGEIGTLGDLLAARQPRLVRMSGSGATCFAIFENLYDAEEACEALHRQMPGWYFEATETRAGDE